MVTMNCRCLHFNQRSFCERSTGWATSNVYFAEQEYVNTVIVTFCIKDVNVQLEASLYLLSGCKCVMQEA